MLFHTLQKVLLYKCFWLLYLLLSLQIKSLNTQWLICPQLQKCWFIQHWLHVQSSSSGDIRKGNIHCVYLLGIFCSYAAIFYRSLKSDHPWRSCRTCGRIGMVTVWQWSGLLLWAHVISWWKTWTLLRPLKAADSSITPPTVKSYRNCVKSYINYSTVLYKAVLWKCHVFIITALYSCCIVPLFSGL